MNTKLYAIFVQQNDKDKEHLIWMALEPNKYGRKYFFGGSGILPCLFFSEQSTRSIIKEARKDFKEGSQFYVRKVIVIPFD